MFLLCNLIIYFQTILDQESIVKGQNQKFSQLFSEDAKPEPLNNPITALGFSTMFTFQLNNIEFGLSAIWRFYKQINFCQRKYEKHTHL